jgi:AraC family transcriptional regulator of arabinose operon
MNETNLIIQNRLREATVSLERANLIICDETWKCDSSVPPFSSIQLVLQGEGTICIDETTIHPTSGQLYLLPAYTNQAFFTDIHNPYRTYYCHFEITCQQTDLFKLIHLPLCIDAKDPKKAKQLFLDLVHSVPQDDIFSALKAKQAVLNLLGYYLECCPPDSVSLVAQTFDSPLSDAIAYVETANGRGCRISCQPLYAAVSVPHGHFSRSVHPSEKSRNRNAAFDLH